MKNPKETFDQGTRVPGSRGTGCFVPLALLLWVCPLNGSLSGCGQPGDKTHSSGEQPGGLSSGDRLVHLLHKGRLPDAEVLIEKKKQEKAHGREPGRQETEEVRILLCRAALLEQNKDLEGSDALLQEAYERLEGAPGENDRRIFFLLMRRAGVLKGLGRLGEADACLTKAAGLARGMKDRGTRLQSLAFREKEALLRESGDYEKELREAIRQHEKLLGRNHPYVARGLYHLALLMEESGRYDEAERYYLHSMEIHKELLGPMHPVIATFLTHLATVLRNNGEYDRAEIYLTEMVGIYEETLSQTEPERLQALKTMVQRSQVDVVPVVQDLIRFEEKQKGSDHPDLAQSLRYYATLLESNNQHAEAEAMIRRALRIHEKTFLKENPERILTRKRLAGCLFSQGKAEEAARLTEETLAMERKAYGERQSVWMPTVFSLATYLQGAGMYMEAEGAYRRVLEYSLNRSEIDDGFVEQITEKLIQVCHEQGKKEEVGKIRKQLQENRSSRAEGEREAFPTCPRRKPGRPLDS